MVFRTVAGILLQVLIPAVVADTYTKHPASNAYQNHNIYHGGEHLDHCERNLTLQQCKDLCTSDCECHCFVVHSGGACSRRHSCETSQFDTNSPDFDVYMKDSHNPGCSLFDDQGYDTQCSPTSLPKKKVTNVGSLEKCKDLCKVLSFECKGIQYLSSCNDKAQDECLIYTSEITSGTTVTPKPGEFGGNYHCLKYVGPVGNTSGLAVSLSMTVNGINGAALLGDQTAADAVVQSIKEEVANQSPDVEPESVIVNLEAGSLIANIQVVLQSATSPLDVFQTLKNNETTLQNQIFNRLDNLQGIENFKSGNPISIIITAFDLNQNVFVTNTSTTTLTGNTEATTVSIEISSGTHKMRVFGIIAIILPIVYGA